MIGSSGSGSVAYLAGGMFKRLFTCERLGNLKDLFNNFLIRSKFYFIYFIISCANTL